MGGGGGPFGLFGGDDDEEAPQVPIHSYTPTLASTRDEFKPINAMQWFDDISGEQFSFVRDLNGNLSVQTRDVSGRPAIDAPIDVNEVNVNLPEVGNLPDFTNRYAAVVATLTAELRNLGNTIQVMENTAPELLPQVAHIINPFKAASERAMNKGFDIYQNGLDKKLTQMGLANSSTALGSQIALQRDRVDAEINNNLQVAELANKAKAQALATQFQLGQQIVQQASVEMNRYNSESQNELTARGQNLGREQLVQQRSSEQARLNMQQEQMRIATELSTRQLRSNLMQSRNPTNTATSLLLGTNQQALGAIQGDNQAQNSQMMGDIANQQVQTQRFQANQAAQSDPMGQLISTGVGALVGGAGGSLGSTLGLRMGGMSTQQATNALGGNRRLN